MVSSFMPTSECTNCKMTFLERYEIYLNVPGIYCNDICAQNGASTWEDLLTMLKTDAMLYPSAGQDKSKEVHKGARSVMYYLLWLSRSYLEMEKKLTDARDVIMMAKGMLQAILPLLPKESITAYPMDDNEVVIPGWRVRIGSIRREDLNEALVRSGMSEAHDFESIAKYLIKNKKQWNMTEDVFLSYCESQWKMILF